MEVDGCVQRSRSMTIKMLVFFVIGTLYHGLLPVFRGHLYKAFPFWSVYPWKKAYQSPYYECIYLIQMVGQVPVGLLFAEVMALFVSVARIMTVQYEMLLVSIRNITSSAVIVSGCGDLLKRERLGRLLIQWKSSRGTNREFYEGQELQDPAFSEYKGKELLTRDEDGLSDIFTPGEFDQGLVYSINECSKRHSLIRKVGLQLEDVLSVSMLNSIGVLIVCVCIFTYALKIIGQANESTVDFVNYMFLSFFEMFIMSYYPALMSHQVGHVNGNYSP